MRSNFIVILTHKAKFTKLKNDVKASKYAAFMVI